SRLSKIARVSGRRRGELAGRPGLAAVLGSLVLTGCGPAAMDPGPPRPDGQGAIIEPRGARVGHNDHVYPPIRPHYAVLAGEHRILLGPNTSLDAQANPSAMQTRVCVETARGHTYLLRPASTAGVWRPEVVDSATKQIVATRLADPTRRRCLPRSYF